MAVAVDSISPVEDAVFEHSKMLLDELKRFLKSDGYLKNNGHLPLHWFYRKQTYI
ncbi:hypothetical protein BuS5_01922 [Desulfosarcina sp. BuS5]|nr:hypothetical protein BuS5_01922 [Desulfosarcina sp. BuS5]